VVEFSRERNGIGYPPRAHSRTPPPSPLVARDLAPTQAFYHVRRKSKRVSSFPSPRVPTLSKFTESPFLRRTLRFTRKLLPVS